MKTYVKPSIEVISVKTSENIADNWIKTMYTRAAEATEWVQASGAQEYNSLTDLTGSDINDPSKMPVV